MTAVLQRINHASVYADGILSGEVGVGLYILLGVDKGDKDEDARVLAEKTAKLRIFSDANGKMNLSALDIGAEALVVSNFTLAANYAHGNRPDYFGAAEPAEADRLYELFVSLLREKLARVETGKFGADMRTEMSTDGPVTIIMRSEVLKKK